MNRKVCIVLVGGPCSGKSSIGKLVADTLNIKYISSGDIARKMAQNNDIIKNNLNMGKLAPEYQMRKAISNKLYQYFMRENRDIVILDGFPRFGKQAEWLRNEISTTIDIKYVLFCASQDVLIERSNTRRRSDDNNIAQRLEYYYNTTLKELYQYINYGINTEITTIDDCVWLLTEFIKEATK